MVASGMGHAHALLATIGNQASPRSVRELARPAYRAGPVGGVEDHLIAEREDLFEGVVEKPRNLALAIGIAMQAHPFSRVRNEFPRKPDGIARFDPGFTPCKGNEPAQGVARVPSVIAPM